MGGLVEGDQKEPTKALKLQHMDAGIFESIALNGLLAMRARLQRDAQIEAEVVAIDKTLTGTSEHNVDIPATKTRNRTTYNVTAEITGATGGTVGDIIVTTKQANGFKVSIVERPPSYR
jgi:hypothetical protein